MARSCKIVMLSDAANIRSGFTFREKVEEVVNGDAHILQIKDARRAFDETNSVGLLPNSLPLIHWEGNNRPFLEAGDILLPARGEYSRAFYLAHEPSGKATFPVIASSQFLILSVKIKNVLPEYICWALNQSSAQNYLSQQSRGSNISMLSVSSVRHLKIPLPSTEIQNRIIQLNNVWEKEQQLSKKLLTNRELMLKGIYKQLLTEQN